MCDCSRSPCTPRCSRSSCSPRYPHSPVVLAVFVVLALPLFLLSLFSPSPLSSFSHGSVICKSEERYHVGIGHVSVSQRSGTCCLTARRHMPDSVGLRIFRKPVSSLAGEAFGNGIAGRYLRLVVGCGVFGLLCLPEREILTRLSGIGVRCDA